MEHSRFFDSVNGDRVYPASSFSEFFASIIGTGVQSLGTNLQVLEVPGSMKVEIQSGVAWVNGYFYMVDADKLQLSIDGADPNDLRYDRIVLRWDLQTRELTTKVLKGIPDVNPAIPVLTRTESIYEISLAKLEITAGKSYLEQSQITDERADDSLCGKAALLVPVDGFDPSLYGLAEDVVANALAVASARATADAAAIFKNAKGLTFPAAATQFQVIEAFITTDTLVSVAPTSKKENFWDVESFVGYFIIYSKDGDPDAVGKAETNAVTFDWSAVKGGS